MWRLKLKETLERFTVLDCKNWTCGTQKIQQQQNSPTTTTANNYEKSSLDSDINHLFKCEKIDNTFGPDIFLTCLKLKSCSSRRNSSSGSSNDDEKNKKYKKISDNEYQFSEDILGAITWSGAIIFGWYASQILCTRRRHLLHSNFEDNRNKYIKYLYIPKRTIYSNLKSHIVLTAPIQPQKSTSSINLTDRIKYVEIQLENKLANSKSNKNLINQSQTELRLQDITNRSELEDKKIKTQSLTNFAEYSTCNNVTPLNKSSLQESTRTHQTSSDKEIKFLKFQRSTVLKENTNLTDIQQNLHHINNSVDSSDSSIDSTTSTTESEAYSTEDSSSFIVFREDKNEFTTAPPKSKIYPKTNKLSATNNITPLPSRTTSSTSSEIPNETDPVSELVHHIADFEYKTAKYHIKRQDYVNAVPHLKRATTHLHPNGIYDLGLCYEKGLGVRRNLEIAMECYQKASHLGHPKATFNLGVFYAKGLGGLSKNVDIARKCIITAAKLGQPDAISFLNSMAVNDEEIAKYLKEQKVRSPSIDSGL